MPVTAPYISTKRVIKGANDNVPVRANLAAWYRFRRGLTNQSGCSSWADYSGNSRPLLQTTASKMPTLLASGELVFNGTTHTMAATFTLNQPATIYIMFRQITWAANAVILDGISAQAQLIQSSTTPQITANAGSALTASSTIGLNAYGIAALVLNGASSVYQAAGGGPSVTTTGNAGSNNLGGITIGSSRSGANFSNIGVRELVVFSAAHDATTRLGVMRYLARLASSVGGVM